VAVKNSRFWETTPHSLETGLTFRKNTPSQSLGPKQTSVRCLVYADFLQSLLVDPEDEGDIFLRNICLLSPDDTALYPTRQNTPVYAMCIAERFYRILFPYF
jgi:hypothetical protein